MKLLRPQVGVRNDGLTEELLRLKLLSADVVVSDLDYTDAQYSPAEDIAFKKIGVNSTNYGYLKYFWWSVWTGLNLISAFSSSEVDKMLEKVKEQTFSDYSLIFLRKPSAEAEERSDVALKPTVNQEISSLLTPSYLSRSLFSGVKEFYQLLTAKKIYLSRNIHPVVKAYAGHLKFDEFEFEVKDKKLALETLLKNNLSWRRMIIRSDGPAEDEMISAARFYQRQKLGYFLEDLLVIKRSLKLNDDFSHCDVLVGSNDYGLVEIMKGQEPGYLGRVMAVEKESLG